MANDLAAMAPKILAMAMVRFRYNIRFLGSIYLNLGVDPRARGTSVDVPIPSSMGEAEDVVPSNVLYQPADIAPKTKSIVLNQWKKKGFYLDDKDHTSVEDGIIPMQLGAAADSLANTVDKAIWTLYKKVYNTVGVPGQTPFQNVDPPTQIYHGLLAAKEARKVLNKASIPMEDRKLMLDVDAEANASALPAFTRADDAGTDLTIREGLIGRKLGMDWFFSQHAPTHTNATTTGSSITVNGNQLAGATTLAVSGCTGVSAGDIFTIAGNDQQYTILAGSTTASWQIAPALVVNVASTTVITLVAASNATVNLAYHRDAFVFVNRPLLDTEPLGNIIEAFTDNVSGLSMRLEITRQYKQTHYELDILYGVEALRPEAAVRIYG